jgi:hypothetical protein
MHVLFVKGIKAKNMMLMMIRSINKYSKINLFFKIV